MSKRMKKLGVCLGLCLTLMMGTSMTTFAQSNENAVTEQTENVVVVEDKITDEEKAKEDAEKDKDKNGSLTPDGNMSLVDDLKEDEASGLQYMTVTTKNGSNFFIIIDRNGREENVYFLNTVDAADLMNIMTDEEKKQFETEKPEVEEEKPILDVEEKTEADEKLVEEETPAKPVNNALPMLAVFGVLGAVMAGGYYMLKIKPKKNQPSIDEDLEFYDDEEYVNEDEEPEFENEDSKESEEE